MIYIVHTTDKPKTLKLIELDSRVDLVRELIGGAVEVESTLTWDEVRTLFEDSGKVAKKAKALIVVNVEDMDTNEGAWRRREAELKGQVWGTYS